MANNSRYLPYHVRIPSEYAQNYLAKQRAADPYALLSAEKSPSTADQHGSAQGNSASETDANVAEQAARIAQLELQYRIDDERVLRAVTAAATSRGGARAIARRRRDPSQHSPSSPVRSTGLMCFPRTTRTSPFGASSSTSPSKGLLLSKRGSPASPSRAFPATGTGTRATPRQRSPATKPGGGGTGVATAHELDIAVTGASLGSPPAAFLSHARTSPARTSNARTTAHAQDHDHFVRYWDGQYWIDRPYAVGISAGSSSGGGEKSGLALGQPVLASIVNGHDRYVNAKQAVALATEQNVHGT